MKHIYGSETLKFNISVVCRNVPTFFSDDCVELIPVLLIFPFFGLLLCYSQ